MLLWGNNDVIYHLVNVELEDLSSIRLVVSDLILGANFEVC